MLYIEKLLKHDRYVEELCERLQSDYDVVLKNVPLRSKRKRLVAEVDILAIKENQCDIYEVKCSYRITKAKHQLRKLRKLLAREYSVRNTFFFCGESGNLVVL